jgi:hypothetical protein
VAQLAQSTTSPDIEAIRTNAIREGGIDPFQLRFRVVEYEKSTGEFLGVPVENLGFSDAVTKTQSLILNRIDSHFCLEPVGFLQ